MPTPQKKKDCMTVLTLQNVFFRYNKNAPVLNDISFTISQEDRIACIGHNGCGKSTLLRIAAGVLRPTKGKVLLHGKPQTQPLLYCSQDAKQDLFLDMTILENAILWEGAFSAVRKGAHSRYAQELSEYLREVHPPLRNIQRRVDALSGGEKQLLLLALLMRRRPHIFLLDEYTSALDPAFKKIVSEKVELFTKKYSIPSLIITHNLHDTRYANRFIALKRGSIILNRSSSTPPTPEEVADLYSQP